MPELPELTVYVERLNALVAGRRLDSIRVASPFVLRTVTPALSEFSGRSVERFSRLGKRLVMSFSGGKALVLHLMVAGRLQWLRLGASARGRECLAAFDFEHGTLRFAEHGSTKRASLHAVADSGALAGLDAGGLEVLGTDVAAFTARLRSESHTLKRALTDPRLFSGIGNAYSDEILHRARLSPVRLTGQVSDGEARKLYDAARGILAEWTARLRSAAGDGWPGDESLAREGMAVHGRFGKPCPVCGTPVQRIRYAEHETNYCPECQTGGTLLADRTLSRLLRGDWPRTLAEMEERRETGRHGGLR